MKHFQGRLLAPNGSIALVQRLHLATPPNNCRGGARPTPLPEALVRDVSTTSCHLIHAHAQTDSHDIMSKCARQLAWLVYSLSMRTRYQLQDQWLANYLATALDDRGSERPLRQVSTMRLVSGTQQIT
eukprot:6196206-Pleurochrysis_carterae.AAC.6